MYPFLARPVLTNRSAVYLIRASEMSHPKWFQEFHPMAGVFPRPLSRERLAKTKIESKMILIMCLVYKSYKKSHLKDIFFAKIYLKYEFIVMIYLLDIRIKKVCI